MKREGRSLLISSIIFISNRWIVDLSSSMKHSVFIFFVNYHDYHLWFSGRLADDKLLDIFLEWY
ncbi:MAG: hypothetical protein ACXAEU_01660 [Candidatus Hodarchaeales archaeon]